MPETSVYEARNQVLKSLGFASYEAYLESPLWKKIRKKVMKRDRNTCQMCYGHATEVHHIQYDRDTLTGKSCRYLIAYCRDCHEALELKDGVKLSGEAVRKRFDNPVEMEELKRVRREARDFGRECAAMDMQFKNTMADYKPEVIVSCERGEIPALWQVGDARIEVTYPGRLTATEYEHICSWLDLLKSQMGQNIMTEEEAVEMRQSARKGPLSNFRSGNSSNCTQEMPVNCGPKRR